MIPVRSKKIMHTNKRKGESEYILGWLKQPCVDSIKAGLVYLFFAKRFKITSVLCHIFNTCNDKIISATTKITK